VKPVVDIFVISLATPILVGIYKDNQLLCTKSKEGRTSEVLPEIFLDILDEYNAKHIIYVNGPGSYMAIKIAYIFLKTIAIAHNIELYSCSGFDTNDNTPIKALGNKYFVQDKKDISIRVLTQNDILKKFVLPQHLDFTQYSINSLPNYHLPAVN
jgi:tRNA A37 threonylcarbamoyladenosine modification protein TsaB